MVEILRFYRSIPDSNIEEMMRNSQRSGDGVIVTDLGMSKIHERANSPSSEGNELFFTAVFDPCDYSSIYKWVRSLGLAHKI